MRIGCVAAVLGTLLLAAYGRPVAAEEWPVGAPPIRVAVGPECPPLFSIGPDGKPRGFVVDYLTEAAYRVQAPIEFDLVADRRAFDALDPMRNPLALWLLADEPFPGYVRFERGFLTLHSSVFRRRSVHGDSDLEATDLGEVIAVRGSEAHQDLLDDGAVDIVTVPTVEEGVLLLSSGKHDTLFATDIYVLQALRDLDIKNVELAASAEMHMHHRFALLRAASRPDVEARLGPALRAMRHDGAFDRVYAKWFGPFEEKEVSLQVFSVTVILIVAAALVLGLVAIPLSRRRLRALLNWQGQALEESEARNAAIMSASPTGIFRLDLNGAVTFGNQEAARITGISDRPVDLKRWLNAIHPDDRAAVAAAWKTVRDHNVSDHREYRFLHPDGEVVWVLDRGVPERDNAGSIVGFVGTLTDITQLKHHEQSYRTHSKVLSSMTEGVNTTDINGMILYTNPAFDAMFGYASGELVGKHVSALNHVPRAEYDRHSDAIRKALHTQGYWTGEFRNRRKDGTEFWTRARISRLEGVGETFGVCVQEDITKAKRAQEALRESEVKFRSVAESAIVGIALYDGNKFVFANDAMLGMVGYTPEELYGMDRLQMIRLFCPDQDITAIIDAIGSLDAPSEYLGPCVLGDTSYKCKDGTERRAWVSIARLHPDQPFPRMFMCVDTTERHIAQEALRDSEEKFRSVAESALVGIALADQGRFIFSNEAMVRLVGYTPEDLNGMDRLTAARLLLGDQSLADLLEALRNLDEGSGPQTIEDVRLMHKNGEYRWARVTVSSLYPGKPFPRLFVCVDVTERKRAQESLQTHSRVLMSMAEGVVFTDAAGIIVDTNPQFDAMFGYARGELAGRHVTVLADMPQTEIDAQAAEIAHAIETSGVWEGVFRDMRKDGSRIWCRARMSAVEINGVQGFVSVQEDITESLRAQEALRESEEKFRRVAESAMVGIALHDGTSYTYINRAMQQIFGYDNADEIATFARDHLAELFFDSSERGRVFQALRQLDEQSNTTEPIVLEDVRIRCKGNNPRWAYIMFSRLYPDRLFPRLTVCVDTTSRKLAEHAVAKHQDMLRRTQQMARIGGWEYDLATKEMQVSDELRHIYGIEPDAPVTWPLLVSRFSEDDQELIRERGTRAVYEQTPFIFEAELTSLHGERVWVQARAEAVMEDGRVVRLVGAVQDVSQIKRVENSLRESEALFRAFSEQMPDALFLIDVEEAEVPGRVLYANAAAARMYGMTEDEIAGIPVATLDAPSMVCHIKERVARLRAGETIYFEGEHLRKDGSAFPVDVVGRRIDALGTNKVLAIVRDITERRKAEEALRRSESRLSLILNTTADLLVLARVEPGGRFILEEINRAYFEYCKRSPAEIIGRERGEFLESLDFPRALIDSELKMYLEAVENCRTVSYEMPFQTQDGLMTFEISIEPIVGPDGRCTHVLWDARDVTARRRAEVALDESRRTLAVLMSNLPGMAYRCRNDDDWTIEFVNEGCLALTGYTVEELSVHRSVSYGRDIIHPHDQEMVWAKVQAGIDSKQRFELVYRIRTAQGQEKWVWEQGRGIYDRDGQLRFLEGFIIDTTARVRADEIARLSEERLKEAQRIAKVGSWELDLVTGEIVWSDEMYRIAEAEKATFTPTYADFIKMVHPDDREIVDTSYRDSVTNKRSNELIHRLRMPDGRIKWVHERYTTYYDMLGQAMRSIGAMQDITELKVAEEERRKLEEQMQQSQRLESLAVLAGGIAHDFNNLLAGILGHVDLAREDLKADDPARESIEQIDVAARRAADLVHQMLAYAGRGNFVIKRVHLGELVREMAKLLEVTLSKKATLEFQLDEAAPPIEADAVQLQQVVMNLITNASDALGDNAGTIRLRTGVVDYGAEALRAYAPHEPSEPGRFVYLEVADTGCGMDAGTLNRIFDPFFTTKFTGRGLGLAATLGIIRGHGGGLRVISRVGGGTTFRIIFPVAREHIAAPEHVNGNAPTVSPSNGQVGTLLVVDDEPRVRDFLVRALQRFGHEVFSAADGRQALDLFGRSSARIDAVLLDITMPGIGGEEVLAQLHAQYPDLPVLLMSGFSEAEARQRLHHNGYAGFLQKPFSIDALRQAVDALFVRK